MSNDCDARWIRSRDLARSPRISREWSAARARWLSDWSHARPSSSISGTRLLSPSSNYALRFTLLTHWALVDHFAFRAVGQRVIQEYISSNFRSRGNKNQDIENLTLWLSWFFQLIACHPGSVFCGWISVLLELNQIGICLIFGESEKESFSAI